jgi:hypothetical protein
MIIGIVPLSPLPQDLLLLLPLLLLLSSYFLLLLSDSESV